MPRRPFLYYITDRKMFPGDEAARCQLVLDKIGETVRSGVDYVQLREKDLSGRELEELARRAVQIVHEERKSSSTISGTRLLINSRTDIALAVGADGVHLRANDLAVREVRTVVSKALTRKSKPETGNFIVSVSCHSQDEVRAAAEDGADFVVFAPVFEKSGAPAAAGAGIDALARACRVGVPVFALGGVDRANARLCLEAGAAGIAGIRLFQQNATADVVRGLRG